MIILTCANSDRAIEGQVSLRHKNFSFKSVIQATVTKAIRCGYTPMVYDLGNLGIGEPYYINNKSFKTKGYFRLLNDRGYRSKSPFKPALVKHCMNKYNDLIVYIDGDAQLCDNIDEVHGNDYDIGVTLRNALEMDNEWYREHFEIVKYLNAGVVFLNPTKAAHKFVDNWQKITEKVGNDQMALNDLACPNHYPEINSIHTIHGVRVKYFPCEKYNYYYFNDKFVPDIKIMHFKGPFRHYYPFDWKRRFYCKNVVPILNDARDVAKKILKK